MKAMIHFKTRRPAAAVLQRGAGMGLLLVLVACGGGSSSSDSSSSSSSSTTTTTTTTCSASSSSTSSVESKVAVTSSSKALLQTSLASTVDIGASVELGALSQAKSALKNDASHGARQVGVARALVSTGDADATASLLQWHVLADGSQAASVSFQSVDAQGVRLGLQVESLPAQATLRVLSTDGSGGFEFSGSDINAAVARNQAAGDASSNARTFWTPSLGGDTVVLEIALPAGADTSAVRVAVPRLSHFVESIESAVAKASTGIGAAGACTVDVACNSSYTSDSNAVARMSYVSDGSSYLCTGTLLNDSSASGTPYFLTASHCISSQTEASSLSTYWFFRASSCGSGTASSSAQQLTSGATLLAVNSATDSTLLRLNATPPSGVLFAGWSTSGVGASSNATVADISHPSGDLQKLSVGAVSCVHSTGSISNGSLSLSSSCSSSGTSASNAFMKVLWSSGTTESGSSGSSLLSTIGGSHYVVGQLTAGSAACSGTSNNGGADYFGSFALAYSSKFSYWLNGTCTTTSN